MNERASIIKDYIFGEITIEEAKRAIAETDTDDKSTPRFADMNVDQSLVQKKLSELFR